jgi:hypothetical protein
MIKIEQTDVFGWEAAIRGMRNPMNSWDKSDSFFCDNYGVVGDDDLKLMKSLSKAGNDHAKFLRFFVVQMDITAPLYWWKEFKTYRKGRKFMDDGDEFLDPEEFEMFIETNSCSTMHKIHANEFELDDFSHEHLLPGGMIALRDVIGTLNAARKEYLATKDKQFWWQMIQLLPSSYNQKRTVQLNYQVLKSMYFARRNHKLDEWREFCKWVETLPYFSEIVIQDGGKEGEGK